jgi:hypothetical protein
MCAQFAGAYLQKNWCKNNKELVVELANCLYSTGCMTAWLKLIFRMVCFESVYTSDNNCDATILGLL